MQETDYRLIEDMLRFKRSKLRSELLGFLTKQKDEEMEQCIKRLLADKKEEKRSAGLDLLLRLSRKKEKAAFYTRVKSLARMIEKPTDKEQIMLEEILGERTTSVLDMKGYGIYDPDAPVTIPDMEEGRDAVLACIPLSEDEIIKKIKKLDALIYENRDYEYDSINGEKQLLENGYIRLKSSADVNRFEDGYHC